jgi:hypothetical protein
MNDKMGEYESKKGVSGGWHDCFSLRFTAPPQKEKSETTAERRRS